MNPPPPPPPPKPIRPRKAISEGYPKRYNIPPPPLRNTNFSEFGRHYSVGRVRGNLAVLPPPPPPRPSNPMGRGGGGGLFVQLAGVFRCGLNFGKMLFRKEGWYVIPFRKLQEKGFSDMYGLGGE